MAHRGLRKTPTRRSLRPRNHGSSSGSLPAVRASSVPGKPSPRTAAESETETGTHRVYARGEDDQEGFPEDYESSESTPAELSETPSHSAREPAAEPHIPSEAAELADHQGAVAHNDPLAHAFFERASADVIHDDAYVIHQLSRGSRRAMFAALGFFAVSVVSIATYTIYQNWVMPAPAELGASLADIPAVPQPEPQNVAPATSRWAVLNAAAAQAPRRVSLADPDAKPNPAGSETQLSAASDPVQFDVQGSAKAQLRANAQPAAAPATAAQAASAQVTAPIAQPAAAAAAPAAPEVQPPVEAKAAPVQFASAAEPGHPSGGLPTSANSGPTYDELVAVGRALSKKNRRVEASEAFRRALLQSPQGSAALSGLGYVFLNADEKQNAREYAQRAVQADASNAEGWIVLGAALEMLGDRAGARDAYRKCVERGQGPYLLECRRVAR